MKSEKIEILGKIAYKGMRFKAIDGKTYEVWSVYLYRGTVQIGVSACGWWFPRDVIEWVPGTLGVDMRVCYNGNLGTITAIYANRVIHVDFDNGFHKSFRECDLGIEFSLDNQNEA